MFFIEIIKSEPVYSSKARPYDGDDHKQKYYTLPYYLTGKHKQSIHKLHKGSSLTGIPTEVNTS